MTAIVNLRTYMTPIEGDLARARLGQAGILSRLESADMLTWLWPYMYAAGGVTLCVLSTDRDRALEDLGPEENTDLVTAPPRICANCGESLAGDWVVCWRCGTDADGNPDEDFFFESNDRTWEPEECAALPALPSATERGDELCRRAMMSAMFGFGWFPPLTLYSFWLLYRAWGVSLGPKGRRWRSAAWFLNIAALVAVGAIVCLSVMPT